MGQVDSIKIEKIAEITSPFPVENEAIGYGGDLLYDGSSGLLKTGEYLAFYAAGRNPNGSTTHPPNYSGDGAVHILDSSKQFITTLFAPEKVPNQTSFGNELISQNGCLFVSSSVMLGKDSYGRVYCFSEDDFRFLFSFDLSYVAEKNSYSALVRSMWDIGDFLLVDHYLGFEIIHSNPSDTNFGKLYASFTGGGGAASRQEFVTMGSDANQVGFRTYDVHKLNLPQFDGKTPLRRLTNPVKDFGNEISTVNQSCLIDDDWFHLSATPHRYGPNENKLDGYFHFLSSTPSGDLEEINISKVLKNPDPTRFGGFGDRPEVSNDTFFSVCNPNRVSNDSGMKNSFVLANDLNDDPDNFSVLLETENFVAETKAFGDSLFLGFPTMYDGKGMIAEYKVTKQ